MKKPAPKKSTTQRAAGKTATSVSLSEETLERARQAAAQDGRSLSNWLENLIKTSIKLIVFLAFIAKLIQGPTDWSAEALAGAAAQGCIWFGQGLYVCASIGWNLFA